MNWTDLDFFKHGDDKIVAVHLAGYINAGINVLPPIHQFLRAFDETPFDDVKVVILGQDPYPTAGHANGLAFSVNACLQPLPKSLKNIYKELEDDMGIHKTCGSLLGWAKQGVFLLNTVLTVTEGKAGSHSGNGWETLTYEAIQRLSSDRNNLVFILWGKKAQLYASNVDETKHLVIKAPHPSPLAAYRGFFGSKPFSRTNEYLLQHSIQEIDWR